MSLDVVTGITSLEVNGPHLRAIESEAKIILEVNGPQLRAIESEAKIILFVAGLGVGKSTGGGIWAQKQSRRARQTLGLVVASTKEQFRDATWPQLQRAWDWMGLIEDEHYVYGRRPPRHWGVPAWHPSSNRNILTWCYSGHLKFGSTERYNMLRGGEPDFILGDELRDWKNGVVEVLVGRLRGTAFKKKGIKSQAFFMTSPPDEPEDVERYFEGEDVELIEGTTFDNYLNLPGDYIGTQKMMLDELRFRREILGERISTAGMRAAYAFVDNDYPKGNIKGCTLDPHAPLWLTWDFNSSQLRPMSTFAIQHLDGLDCVVKEWVNPGTNTGTQCDIIYDWLIENKFSAELHIRGDATGDDAARNSSTSLSDYRMIERKFRSGPWNYQGHRTRRTRRVKDRVSALNARLESWPECKRLLVIDPSCRKLRTALRKLRIKENNYELEQNEFADPFDSLSYYAFYEYPLTTTGVTPASTNR